MPDSDAPKPLIEPSFAAVMAANDIAMDLTEDQRRHRLCSLRIIAKALGKPPELLPARWTAVRIPISHMHHAPMGVTAKTLANHKANVRAALSWFAEEENVPSRGAPLSADWAQTSAEGRPLPHARPSLVPHAILVGPRHRARRRGRDVHSMPVWPIGQPRPLSKPTPRPDGASRGRGIVALVSCRVGLREG